MAEIQSETNKTSNLCDFIDEVQPFCHTQGCTCPTGYELIETVQSKLCRLTEPTSDLSTGENEEGMCKFLKINCKLKTQIHRVDVPYLPVPCDVENNCNQNAQCEWVESELRNKCVCRPGFEGDGFECVEREVSCLFVSLIPFRMDY